MPVVAAHDLLQEHQVGAGAAHGFTQLGQDEAPVEGGEAFVGIHCQYPQTVNGGGLRQVAWVGGNTSCVDSHTDIP